MSKPFVIGLITGLALLIVGGVAGFQSRQKTPEQIREQQELELYQKEIVDATPVQLGVLTDNQRIHSRFYTHYLQERGGRSISGLVAKIKGKGKIVETIVFVPLMRELTEPEIPERYFGKLAHASDAIIRGKVTKKTSQVAEDDSFVFTDYGIVVAEVLKNNLTAPIETDATITVTRPGGKVLLDGIIVKAKDAAFAPLPLNKDVVLFLKFIPEIGTYRVTEATGVFELDGSSLRPLTKLAFPPGVLQGSDSFLQTLRAVSKE